jgi:hypothetical protein
MKKVLLLVLAIALLSGTIVANPMMTKPAEGKTLMPAGQAKSELGVTQTVITVADEKIFKSITAAEMGSLLKGMGVTFEEKTVGDNVIFKFKLGRIGGGFSVILLLSNLEGNTCQSLQLHAGFSGSYKAGLNGINEWNRSKKFSRAYLDRENEPHLESDLNLKGGVTEAAIKDFFRIFELSVNAFAYHLNR